MFSVDVKKEAVAQIDRVFPNWKKFIAEDVMRHSDRVCDMAVMISKRYGYDLNFQIEVAVGSLLHDIGKFKVNQAVLNKEDELSEDDKKLIDYHPHDGYQMAKKMHFPKRVLDIIHFHHEKLDGSGFPEALDAKKIDIGVQIVTVCDMFEGFTAERVYHPSRSVEEGIKFLRDYGQKKVNQTACTVLEDILSNEGSYLFK